MKNPRLLRTSLYGLAVMAILAAQARADVIDDHVVVTQPYHGPSVPMPAGYDAVYALQLGTGSWPLPYVDVYVDKAEGKSSYARLTAAPSYLTYVHNVELFAVKPGDEISSKTLSDGSFIPFFKVTDWDVLPRQDIVSLDGSTPDIYLGFAISPARTAVPTPDFGWVHLKYTQQAGLTMVDSAMTTTDAGIYALSRTTISSVDEPGTQALVLLGAAGLWANLLRRKAALGKPARLAG